MIKLLWWFIKAGFIVFLISLSIEMIVALVKLLAQLWWLFLLCGVLAIIVYFYSSNKSRKNGKTDSDNLRIFPDLGAFIDKGFSKAIEAAATSHNVIAAKPSKKKYPKIEEPQIPRNLTTLMEEGKLTIETKQQLQEFYDSHMLLRSFITKVVGVSYPNDDGSSRQEILSHCLIGEPVGFYWHEFRGAPACAVISLHGQIGYLKADLAADLHEQYVADDDENIIIFMAKISDITGGEKGLSYGCSIILSIYAPKKPEPIRQTRITPKTVDIPKQPLSVKTGGSDQGEADNSNIPAPPPPDATDWNSEIPVEELTGLLAQRPFYDNYLMRCTPDGRGDLPERFSDLSKFVVLDVETTGLNPQRDRIIEVAAVKFENFQVTGTFATLINPLIPLPRRITELTGITQAELRTAPQWQEKQSELLEFIDGYTLVGHNLAGFDIRFLNKAIGKKLPNSVVDTLEYSRTVFPELPRHKLSYLKHVLDIPVETSHRALEDVKTTFFLLVACMRQEDSMEPIYRNEAIATAETSNCYVPPIPPKTNHKHKNKSNTKDIVPTCTNIDINNPLFGKRVVFTGELSMLRAEAMQLAVNCGALLRTSVSRKTDYLIVGIQDPSAVGSDGMSTKEEKAHFLNDAGEASIQIIDEKQFCELLTPVSNSSTK